MVHRLDQVKVDAGFLRPAFVLILAPPGQGDHHRVLAPRLLSDAAAHFIASVQPGEWG